MNKYNNDVQQAIGEYNFAIDQLCEEIKKKLKLNPEAYSIKDMLESRDAQQNILTKPYRGKLKKSFNEMYDVYTVDLEKFRNKMEAMGVDDLK